MKNSKTNGDSTDCREEALSQMLRKREIEETKRNLDGIERALIQYCYQYLLIHPEYKEEPVGAFLFDYIEKSRIEHAIRVGNFMGERAGREEFESLIPMIQRWDAERNVERTELYKPCVDLFLDLLRAYTQSQNNIITPKKDSKDLS